MKLHWKNTEYRQFCASYRILPGQKICLECKNKIFVNNVDRVENQNQGQGTDEETVLTDDLSFEADFNLVN